MTSQVQNRVSMREMVGSRQSSGSVCSLQFLKNVQSTDFSMNTNSISLTFPPMVQEYLDKNLKTHDRQCAVPFPQDSLHDFPASNKYTKSSQPNLRLSPKNFGHPNSRDRAWRICYRRGVKRWASQYSFEQLAKILLMDGDSKLALDYRCYLFEREMDPERGVIPEDQLSRCLTFSSNMRHFNMNSFLKCQQTTFKILSR